MADVVAFYDTEQVKIGEQGIANELKITMYELMQKAGTAVFQALVQSYPDARSLIIFVGKGNNGGDGYVVARLALLAGYRVQVYHHGDQDNLTSDSHKAKQDYLNVGGSLLTYDDLDFQNIDLVIDALLGTGLNGDMYPETCALIHKINHLNLPIMSIDIPSGLCANTGFASKDVIKADITVCLIAIKSGLITGSAREYVGKLVLDDLGVNEPFCKNAFAKGILTYAKIKPRKPTYHKGNSGHSLVIGGDAGMGGALLLSSEACLRSGAGLVASLTDTTNVMPSLVRTPEVMASDWQDQEMLSQRLSWATALGFGPGLGLSSFAKHLFIQISQQTLPKVFDADALNILSLTPNFDDLRILTPHPGEAARLLNCTIKDIEQDRYQAVQKIQSKYGGVVVLKGAGTVIYDGKQFFVCAIGNASMATGGMGDVLTGVITSLLAQGYNTTQAAVYGVHIHSLAGDLATKTKPIGLIASDVIAYLSNAVYLSSNG
ncbi:NAD(P)H-hydrate dehydratase [Photobacterium damselae]|uniref:NAD(P)H-hydrate dehydratase n=1 Tax=Photobacterium damselae TaxID=38293 RepID=UPI001EDD559C|nr:NAD(P)H-hydrate dehydratase [Photobacterium damselae]